MKLLFEPLNDPDIDFVWRWFEFQIDLIGEEHARVLRALLPEHISGEWHPRRQARFVGLTREEVEDFFEAQRGELESLTMFELLATAEAILRIDFKARVIARKKDALSRRFREIDKARGDKIRLDEDILAALKEEGAPATVIGEFRGTLRLRHWLAHGRHWHPKLGRGYAPGDVFDTVRALLNWIPLS